MRKCFTYFLSALVSCHGWRNVRLVLEELFEVSDAWGSAAFIMGNFDRLWLLEDMGFLTCADGFQLLPASPRQCPVFDTLPLCSNATVDEFCSAPAGECRASEELNNCGSMSVFKKDVLDIAQAESVCRILMSFGIVVFSVSLWNLRYGRMRFVSGDYKLEYRSGDYKLEHNGSGLQVCQVCGCGGIVINEKDGRDWWYGYFLLWCLAVPLIPVFLLFLELGHAVGPNRSCLNCNEDCVTWAIAPILINAAWTVGLVSVANMPLGVPREMYISLGAFLGVWYVWTATKNFVLSRRLRQGPSRLAAALDVPVWSAMVAMHLEEDTLRTIEERRAAYKRWLRLSQDIPALVLDFVDMSFFGVSWWNAANLAATTVPIIWHLGSYSVRLFRRAAAAAQAAAQAEARSTPTASSIGQPVV